MKQQGLSSVVLLLLLGMCITRSVMAIAPLKNTYQFEMLIFSDLTQQTIDSEQWPSISPTTVTLTNPSDPDYQSFLKLIDYKSVPKYRQYLNYAEKKIQSNPDFKIIYHLAWQEQVPPAEQALPIRIFGGNAYDTDGQLLSYDENQKNALNTYPQWQLNGDITISLNRYFNTRFNLLFAQPTANLPSTMPSNTAPSSATFTYFRLLQTRRTKSNELNYVDNPLYRIIFLIKKIPA